MLYLLTLHIQPLILLVHKLQKYDAALKKIEEEKKALTLNLSDIEKKVVTTFFF